MIVIFYLKILYLYSKALNVIFSKKNILQFNLKKCQHVNTW